MRQTMTWISRWLVVTGLVWFSSLTLYGQEKIEREFRIKPGTVPEAAKDWLYEAFGSPRKVKWYVEETSGKSSYEAKFVFRGATHSVEFDLSGRIEDIEVQTTWEALPESTRESIGRYFNDTFKKYRIEKIQVQYTGAPEDLKDSVKNSDFVTATTRYEIEFYGENETSKQLWEGLFDENGNLLSRREIAIPSTNHLFF
ncbi:hypothetical protein SAMN05192553_10113 [Cyclobacterium xiamenense]|uniref:Beta-lactamase-inhibitor-like, PepSY-like n=2 Tax=Cyclobacterium xiamenense TaxID=1297121 RepID=A0A1H6TBC0_9BACT|nr:hypothetical protein SAMN05192553_10113 [Cyclobacterium xiamenense]